MTKVAAAILMRDGRILICKRPEGKSQGGLWEFPGGKLEPDETPEICLARELYEELDIHVSVGEVYAVTRFAYPERTIDFTFLRCSLPEGEPLPLEHSSICWVQPHELKDYAFCPADVEIAGRIQKEGL